MNYLAEAHGLWYEGNQSWMQLVQQHGLLLPAQLPNLSGPRTLLFREDHFDAVTRVRCGRLYERTYESWTPANVSPKPYRNWNFHINTLYKTAEVVVKRGATVALGRNDGQSRWVVVLAERAEDAHYLTLKSKTYFGALPQVNYEVIPETNRQDIRQALDAVVEAAPHSGSAACH